MITQVDPERLIRDHLPKQADLQVRRFARQDLTLFYISSLTDTTMLQRDVLPYLQQAERRTSNAAEWSNQLAVAELQEATDLQQVLKQLMGGWSYLHINGTAGGLLLNTVKTEGRQVSGSEIESNVIGPQQAFSESLAANVALIRQYVSGTNLAVEELTVGKRTSTKLNLLYLEEIAAEQNVNTVRQRISDLQVDSVIVSSILAQLIEDKSSTVFPQLILTERPDRVAMSILEGKIAVIAEGSPLVIVGPSSFWDFFKSPEDHYVRWNIASVVRAIRVLAMLLSIYLSPFYVAALTFHYQVIPSNLLDSLAESRSKVPFPPLFEAIMLELMIELLREAGARLPTKVGQTMGIVGGIVIGQAAVEAGFTSNILIMLVALGALASFTSPSYLMGMTVRVLRFPMLILSGLWGAIGIALGTGFLLIHLLRLTSWGSPYLQPVYPLRIADTKDSILRLPYQFLSKRTSYLRSKDTQRFSEQKARERKDIDE